jgi:hypothetical protein
MAFTQRPNRTRSADDEVRVSLAVMPEIQMASAEKIERDNADRLSARLRKAMDPGSAALIVEAAGEGYRDYSEFIALTEYIAANAQGAALKKLAQRHADGTTDAIVFGEAALDAARECLLKKM